MASFKIKGLRWWMIGLLMLGSIVNYLTRASFGVAATTLQSELHITDAQYAWIGIAFQLCLMLQPFCGYVMDVVGLKRGFAIFALTWSLASMAHGLVHTWQGFAALRGLMGLAEGCANPAGMKATATWFPARERGFAGGIFNMGASAGSALAAPLIAWAILHFNWQIAFVITGALGLVWLVLWLSFYQAPDRHRALSTQEKEMIASGQETHLQDDGRRPSVPTILRQRNFWGIALPRMLADPTWGMLTIWMPKYLIEVRGFDLKHIALFAWLPFLAADLGCMSGGTIVKLLERRGIGLINARRGAFTVGTVLMMGMPFIGFVESPYLAVALFSLGGFAHQTLSVTVITMSSDLFKRSEVATVAGLAGTLGNGGIVIMTWLIGHYISIKSVGYTPFFISLAILDIIGAVILWTVVRERKLPVTA